MIERSTFVKHVGILGFALMFLFSGWWGCAPAQKQDEEPTGTEQRAENVGGTEQRAENVGGTEQRADNGGGTEPVTDSGGGPEPTVDSGGRTEPAVDSGGGVDAGEEKMPDQGGTPESGGTEGTTGKLSFATDIYPILQAASCTSNYCHGSSGGLTMSGGASTAYGNLVDVDSKSGQYKRVKPGDSAASLMFLKVSQDSPPEGRRMPRGGNPLAQGDIDKIKNWIDQGAAE